MAGSSPRQDTFLRHERFTPWITSSSARVPNASTRPVWQIIQELPGKLRLPESTFVPGATTSGLPRTKVAGGSDFARLLHGEVAGREVTGAQLPHHRLLGGTAVLRPWAAGTEPAAAGRVDGRGQLARGTGSRGAVARRPLGGRDRRQQDVRVRVQRRPVEVLRGRHLAQ